MALSSSSAEKGESNINGGSPEVTLVEDAGPMTAFAAARDAHEKHLRGHGDQIRLMPMPTPDPKDPLNLPPWQKYVAIASLCLFGALAAAAELILGAMLPIFSFVYTTSPVFPEGPKWLVTHPIPPGTQSLYTLSKFPGPPIEEIYLLASLPILMMGVVNFFLVPLAISVGRRTILLTCGALALAACMWSGFSTSLPSHLGGRCIQALGAGTVESLIPFIIQDIVFAHQRNSAISIVFAAQGLIVVGLGLASPYIIAYLDWRWVYYVTAAGGLFFWFLMFLALPETRFQRPIPESQGIPSIPLQPGQHRPELDFVNYTPRTWVRGLGIFSGPPDWQAGWDCFWDTLRTFFYPHIFFVTILNSVMIAITLALAYTVAPQLLAPPYAWPFLHLGFCVFPIVIAALTSYLISGWGADTLSNWVAKKNGRRNPEFQVLNLIPATLAGVIGSVLFGLAGEYPDRYHWAVFLLGLGLVSFGFLSTNTIGIVYVLEVYPHMAGPALVNIASFRLIIAFLLVFRISEFIIANGYLVVFGIYAGVLGAFIFTIPVIYFYGESWRKRWPATPKGHVALW